jgi:hypothetical protein
MFDYNTDATKVSFSTDIWSLSALLFHLASGQLPFHSSTPALARKNIVDRQQIAPDVRDLAPKQIQGNISLQFAAIIAKGLQKSPEKRFKSARDMASALHECLVKQSEAVYSIYLTYVGPSEKICALLLHYLLNCKTTDKGTRVFVCMRPFLLDNKEQWKGLSQGLLNSLVAVPILSYSMIKSLEQLKGNEEDYFNRTLHEVALMQILREIPSCYLKRIYPLQSEVILSPDNSKSAFSPEHIKSTVQDLVPRPSPPIVRSVERFMRANSIACSQHLVTHKSVKDSISDFLQMQGAHPWQYDRIAVQKDPDMEAEAYNMLKTYVMPEDLPLQNEFGHIMQNLGAVAKDICKFVDEAHNEFIRYHANSLDRQVKDGNSSSKSPGLAVQLVFPAALSSQST